MTNFSIVEEILLGDLDELEIFMCSLLYNPTKVTPDDLRRWRPTDFTVKSSIAALDYF